MLRRRHLGRVPFEEANDLQHALVEADDDYVLILEHPATYTRGVRASDASFLVDPTTLNAVVVDADRGARSRSTVPAKLSRGRSSPCPMTRAPVRPTWHGSRTS
jgi:hypothetical protein